MFRLGTYLQYWRAQFEGASGGQYFEDAYIRNLWL